MFRVPEKYRIKRQSSAADGNNGAFLIKSKRSQLFIIASDGAGWEHVSVSVAGQDRTPVWREMCRVKDLFWEPQDFVVQMHPPRDEYVNCAPNCLHLWRREGSNDFCERPPWILVGLK
jgi:hypothetical protein